MELLWYASIKNNLFSQKWKPLYVFIAASFLITGCLPSTETNSKNISSASSVGSSSSSSSTAGYESAGSVKVIFNKQSFYDNYNTNTSSCAGDARAFYDPFTDRQIPTKPNWIKNIAVEVTNSNALQGPSNAIGCALTGLNASSASSCATFDTSQPNTGDSFKLLTIGGRGCLTGDSTCTSGTTSHYLNDIWVGSISDVSSNSSWAEQSGGIPGETAATRGGTLWAAGDFDELHNEFYSFGGVDLFVGDSNSQGILNFSKRFKKFSFLSDGTLNTNPVPINFDINVGDRTYTFNWDLGEIGKPSARIGSTMTYSLRRDPTMKSNCTEGGSCQSSNLNGITGGGSKVNAVAINEHSDYFLLTGGVLTTGLMSSQIWAFKPHAYSNDVGTGSSQPIATGDVTRLYNSAIFNTTGQSIVDISTTSSSTAPFTSTTTTFSGRAFHRTVFDPKMNRFYIFGGLKNNGTSPAISGLAGAVIPDINTSEVWLYDPPALGRRPTSTCWTEKDPNGDTLLTAATNVSDVIGARHGLNVNKNYLSNQTVFPPGGCLQRIKLPNSEIPKARFEHAMAFDRDQDAVFLFGGCTQAALLTSNSTINAGNPLSNCTQNALLNDIWIYVPPKSVEIVPNTFSASTGPYSSSKFFPNIFGSDFWLDHFPLYTDNAVSNGTKSVLTQSEVMGKWISLSPTGNLPTVRASAGFIYDRAHHKFYLHGGYGCSSTTCPQALNDLWEYTPPHIETECDVDSGICNNQGSWTQIRPTLASSNSDQPTLRYGFLMAASNPSVSFGDQFYTATDSACFNQGPIASNDASVSKKNVGAIYIDLNRDQMGSSENVLLNLRFLPFDKNTKLPGISDNNTPQVASDDADYGSVNDEAIIRIQLMSNFIKYAEQIQSLIQPRYHEFISGTPVYADTFAYIAGATGQVTEKQVLIPLNISSDINMIKIERVQGSAKFFELTVSKF